MPGDWVCDKANGAKCELWNRGGGRMDLLCSSFNFSESLKLYSKMLWGKDTCTIFKNMFIGQAYKD